MLPIIFESHCDRDSVQNTKQQNTKEFLINCTLLVRLQRHYEPNEQ